MVAKRKKVTKVTRPAKKAARTKKVTRAKKSAAKKPATRRPRTPKLVDPNSPTRPAIMADLFATRREILATVDQEVCEIVDNAVVRERRVGIASRVLPELVARDFGPEEAADLALHYADALIEKARDVNRTPELSLADLPQLADDDDLPAVSASAVAKSAILDQPSVN